MDLVGRGGWFRLVGHLATWSVFSLGCFGLLVDSEKMEVFSRAVWPCPRKC